MTEGLDITRRRHPHWTLKGSTYFVTWRLLENIGTLSDAERELVVNSLLHFQDERYRLLAYVVMDDHVHVIVRPLGDYTLSSLIHSWKSYTANQINVQRGAQGALWQADRFDRIIRSERELLQKMQYIVSNSSRRWPDVKDYAWVGWFADG